MPYIYLNSLLYSKVASKFKMLADITPGVRGGRPCVRGMRIREKDILDMLAAGSVSWCIAREPSGSRPMLNWSSQRNAGPRQRIAVTNHVN
jgi:hypothetical protein